MVYQNQHRIQDPIIDLSGMGLAIVGGHRRMHREVLHSLRCSYGLSYGVAIPPMHERSTNQMQLNHCLRDCDLIAIVTGYASHTISHMVSRLVRKRRVQGQIVQINSRGKTGVLREVISNFDFLINQRDYRPK